MKSKPSTSKKKKPADDVSISDAWFRTTLYSIGDAVITTDTDGNVLQMNHIAEQLTGWDERDAVGKHVGQIYRIVNEDTRSEVESPVEKVFREGTVVGLANHSMLISKDGREIPIADSGSPIRDSDGTMLGSVLVFRDQSSERDAERNLRESERKLSTLLSNLPGMSYRCRNDRQWTMEFVSEGCNTLTGYQPEDLLYNNKLSYNDLIHSDDREWIWVKWQDVLKSRRKFAEEYRILTNDGRLKWVWEQGQGIFSDNGTLIALEGFITDITERKRAEEALRGSEEKYRLMIDNQTDLVVKVDHDGRFIFVSPSYCDMFGFKEEELIGKTFFPLVHEDDREAAQNAMKELLKPPHRCYLEQRAKTRFGWKWLAWSDSAILDEHGKIEAIIGVGRDITEKKQTEEALRESEQMLDTILNTIPVRVFWKDLNGVFLGCNDPFARDAGITSPEELIGKTDYDMGWAKEAELYQADDKAVIESGEPKLGYEEPQTTSDGDRIWLRTSKFPLRNASGAIAGILGVYEDITEHRQAMEALSRSESQFRTLWEESLDGMRLTDGNGTVLLVNDAFCKLAGMPREEIEGKPLSVIYAEENRDHILQVHRERFRTRTVKPRFEQELALHNGKRIWFDVSNTFFEHEGRPPLLLAVFRDVTERKEAEKDLIQAKEALERAEEYAKLGSWDLDLGANRGRWSNQMFRMFDLEPADHPPDTDTYLDLIHPDDRDIVSKVLTLMSQGKEPPVQVFRTNPKRLPLRYFKPTWKYLRDTDGKPVKYEGTLLDVTEHIRAEEALRTSEEKYRTLFEESKDTVYMSTPDGKLLDINTAGLETFGYSSKEEMLAIDIARDIYHNPEEREKFVRALDTYGYVKDFEKTLKRKDGQDISVIETTTVVRDGHGKPVAYRGILRDITRQKVLEEHLRDVQKMESIGTLAGGIAHDFNNLLGIILGHASLMKLHQSDPAKLEKSIEVIHRATRRGASLVQHLLTFARKTDVVVGSVRVGDLIDDISHLLRETLPRSITVNVDIQKDLPVITADATQIHQVLLNLCLNARDAMPKGGELSIAAATVPGEDLSARFLKVKNQPYLFVRVSDTGTGIDESIRKRIFDPFFTTKGPGKGTGLGLALVYSIVESYGGFVDVDSEPGRGAAFSLYIPARIPDVETSIDADDASTAPRGMGEKILVIEDEDMLLESLKTILIENGYNVITARDGEEGILLYNLYARDLFGEGIRAVVSDLGLPKIGGDEVCRRIRDIDPKAVILLASGFIDPLLKTELREAGAKFFIQKPYSPEKVLRIIREAVDSRI